MINNLSEKLKVNKLLIEILLDRGYSEEEIITLYSNEYDIINDDVILTNANEAADIINKYIKTLGSKIHIFGDYDVDGLDAGYILYDALTDIKKNNVNIYYPSREEGYGLNMDFCKSIIEEDNSKTLVITVDNGVSALKEIEFLKDNNIEVIVLDHHEPQKTLPNCCIVNPVVYNDKQKYFSGCAVVFNTIKAYKQKYKNNINLEKYLPYTAFSLIADMMDMSLENQIYIKEGLKLMKNNSFFKLYKDYLNRALNPKIISWKVAPVINATGRVSHINEAACLMYETDEEEMLNQFNVIQKIYEDSKNTKKEALSYIKKLEHTDDKIMFIDGQNYAKGIYSILAGQGTDYFKKPCVVYDGSKEETSGSCRSIEGLNIKEILTKEVEKGNMISVGGHEQACGVSFKLNKIEDIIKSINKELDYVVIDKTPISDKKIKTYDVGIKDINKNLYYCIHSLAYDKYNFTEPIFSVKGKLMSFKSSKNNPLNIELTIIDKEGNSKSFWWWGGKEFFNPEDYINKEICLLGNIDIDFMNRITLSIIGGKGI